MARNSKQQHAGAMFDADMALAEVRQVRKVMKRRIYNKSRLDRFRAELAQMHRAGASLGDLQVWLRKVKRVRVDRSTIHRYLQKLPELMGE